MAIDLLWIKMPNEIHRDAAPMDFYRSVAPFGMCSDTTPIDTPAN